jgi:DNA invertase Pin-like site-specific DNA recombinase
MIKSVKQQAINDLKKQGHSVTDIGRVLSISRPTIYKYLRKKTVEKSPKIKVKKSLLTKIKRSFKL